MISTVKKADSYDLKASENILELGHLLCLMASSENFNRKSFQISMRTISIARLAQNYDLGNSDTIVQIC